MAYTSTAILLAAPERSALEKNVRGAKTEQRLALRSRIILLAADGMGTGAIAAQLRRSRQVHQGDRAADPRQA
jgi:hypothetical protein